MNLARDIRINEGRIQIGNDGNLNIGGFTPNDSDINDWIYRHEGLQKAIYNHQIVIEAISSPNDFVEKKRLDLNRIAINMRDMVRMEFKRYLEAGNTQESAKSKALKFANEYKKKALASHQKQYPEDLSYTNLMRLLEIKKVVSDNKKD